MKRCHRMLALSVCLVATGLLSPVRAAEQTVRQELESYYRRFSKAVTAKTSDDLRHLVEQKTTSDFVRKTPYGTEPRRAYLEGFKVHWGTPPDQAEETLEKLSIQGNQAVALVKDITTRTLPIDDQTQRVHTIRGVVSFRDTWVKTAVGWRLKQRELVGQEFFRDGKLTEKFPPWPSSFSSSKPPVNMAGSVDRPVLMLFLKFTPLLALLTAVLFAVRRARRTAN